MMYFGIYCLTIIPLVLSGGLVLKDVSTITNCSDCIKFPSENSGHSFSLFSVIMEKENTPTVLVGARGSVLQISMDGTLIHHISIPKDAALCKQKNRECRNIVDTIIPQKTGLILACARNIHAKCWKANETHVIGKELIERFYIRQKKEFVISEPYMFEGFTSTQDENLGILRKININETSEDIIQGNLASPGIKFVSVYEFGNYIYYFFTDLSQEVSGLKAGRRVTYARVGRMCKYDKGGRYLSRIRDMIVTFSNARLVCTTTTNEETFEYNHLEMTSFMTGDDGEIYMYGLFRAAKPADEMFAVCRYSFSEIAKVFTSRKYYDITNQNSIKIVNVGYEDPRHLTCNSSINTRVVGPEGFKDYRRRRIHVETVSPDGGQPVLAHSHQSRISHIFADFVTIAKKSYDVVRYFDSNLMYELFVPIKFFHGAEEETVLLTRQISEDPVRIIGVTKIKYNGVSPEIPAPSSSILPSSTSSTPKPSVSSSITSGSLNTKTPSVYNSTSSSNNTMLGNSSASLATPSLTPNLLSAVLGNVSTYVAKPNFSHVTTANLLSTNSLSTVPRVLATPSPSRTTSSMPSSVSTPNRWAGFVNQEKIVIASEKKLVFVPVASCGAYTSCRECVAAMNPYCGWHDGSCVQLSSNQDNRTYIQDKDGNYSKVCPRVNVNCELVMARKLVPDMEVTLKCSSSGVPTPHVLSWSKNDTPVSLSQGIVIDKQELRIRRYTLNAAGKYTCHVTNGVTSNSCSVEIPGSLPQTTCKIAKHQKEFWLACNATGYPQPKVVLASGECQQADCTKVSIERDHKYQFIAYNAFGPKSGGVYEIISKSLEFEIKDVEWSAELYNTESSEYIDLKNKVTNGVREVYKDNNLFQDVTNISFRKGSVIATIEVTGLNTPSSDESEFTRELKNAIVKGSLGDLEISEYDGKPDVSDQKSTSSAPSTTRPLQTTDSSVPAVAHSSESSGVEIWLLFLLLIIIGLIVFVVGYCCGLKDMCCLLFYKLVGRQRTCSKGHDDDDDDEDAELGMKSISRSEKARESERNLLGKHKAKKQKSPVKKNNHETHELTNNVSSKEGSIEIKPNDNSSGQSTC